MLVHLTSFTVLGEPQGKGRPRISRFSNHPYTPEKTVTYEGLVRTAYLESFRDKQANRIDPPAPIEGAFGVRIWAVFGIPKSVSKTKREEMLTGKIKPTKKPDIDNIAKVVMDALNGAAWTDDKNCIALTVNKEYGSKPWLLVDIYKEQ